MATPETYDAFAIVAPGLEELARRELRELGARGPRMIEGGVSFRASRELLYRANLCARVVSRVVVRASVFHAASFPELERRLKRVDWSRWLTSHVPTRVRVTCRKSRLYHSDAVAERVSTVVAAATGSAPETGGDDEGDDDGGQRPAQLLLVRLDHDECTVSIDSSGQLLHQRGYRLAASKAPLRETLAAGAINATLKAQYKAIFDPMCGSGTIPIEVAMLLRRIPPGLSRTFAFQRWPDFDQALWERVRGAAEAGILPSAGIPIIASDRDQGAIKSALDNAKRAGVLGDIVFEAKPISASSAPPNVGRGLLLSNPPYGVRVGDRDSLRDLYARFGSVLRERFAGWDLALISADRRLEAQLRVSLRDVLSFSNGGIPVRLVVGSIDGGLSNTNAKDNPRKSLTADHTRVEN
ncbi:MAG: hypothetical protein U0132_18490 [Gemmatimonadaceae bacterium]